MLELLNLQFAPLLGRKRESSYFSELIRALEEHVH